ncbi:MAG: hypothetical protein EXQ79_05715 [Acidimicrobiia bacterium]|nr:hypothetical protein [Acidimicrobiia bacterium]
MRRGILIISASMGAGHNGAAYELERRLKARGHEVRVVDFLPMLPFGYGSFLRWGYHFQLDRLPASYEASYSLFSRALGRFIRFPIAWVAQLLVGRALRKELEGLRPDAVVSTYWLASLVLGRMRKRGTLRVPVASYLCDFAVHPLWVHPGVDLNLTVSPTSALAATGLRAKVTHATGPLVSEQFRAPHGDRDAMRRDLGIEPHERAVLVVAGSWGVGQVTESVEAIERCGEEYHPITVCGGDERLRASLVERGVKGTVLGWTDKMPQLMAASDATVENAGGLTAMEAFAAGLPVISYRPIPGHGKDNASCMSGAGVNRYARNEEELAAALRDATNPGPARDGMIAAGRALFAADPADDALELAENTPAHALLTPVRVRRGRRRTAFVAASLCGLYFALTVGAQGVAALGVGVAKPPKGAVNSVYLGVRVTAEELRDPNVVAAIAAMDATVVVDGRTASRAGSDLQTLADAGVDLANGGWGKGRFLRWDRAQDDCNKSSRVIAAVSGERMHEFVPGRSFDAFDQLYCRTGVAKQRLVHPNVQFRPESETDPKLEGRKIYLLDGRKGEPGALVATLEDFAATAARQNLDVRPLEELR